MSNHPNGQPIQENAPKSLEDIHTQIGRIAGKIIERGYSDEGAESNFAQPRDGYTNIPGLAQHLQEDVRLGVRENQSSDSVESGPLDRLRFDNTEVDHSKLFRHDYKVDNGQAFVAPGVPVQESYAVRVDGATIEAKDTLDPRTGEPIVRTMSYTNPQEGETLKVNTEWSDPALYSRAMVHNAARVLSTARSRQSIVRANAKDRSAGN